MNQLNMVKIYIIFTQQQDANSAHVPIDDKSLQCRGDTDTYPGSRNKVQNFHGLKVLKSYSLFPYYCGIMLEINIKRYLKITYIFLRSAPCFQVPLKA